MWVGVVVDVVLCCVVLLVRKEVREGGRMGAAGENGNGNWGFWAMWNFWSESWEAAETDSNVACLAE